MTGPDSSSAGAGPGHVPAAPPAPVRTAVTLMFVRAALSVLGTLVLLLTRESLRTTLLEQNSALSPAQVDAALSIAISVGLVLGGIFAVLYVLLALQVRKGRGWARTLTLVLAALSVLAGLTNVAEPAPAVTGALGLLTLVLEVGILGLLLTRPAAEYFRTTR